MSDGKEKSSDIETKINKYIDERLFGKENGYLGYYDKTAARMKKRHEYSRAAAALGAVLIPVVSNVAWGPLIPVISEKPIPVATIGASLIGLGVALILALEGVYHWKEQWQNFRGTEQYLRSQRFRFENGADEYQSLSREDAFKLFVSRVEKAIIDENNVTLNILGRSEGMIQGPPGEGAGQTREHQRLAPVPQNNPTVVPHTAQ
jgi:hypothetical protein